MIQESVTPQIAGSDGITYQNPAVMLDGSAPQAGSWTSSPIYVGGVDAFSVVVSCPATGTPLGTVKLQACCDRARNTTSVPDSRLTNFYDLPFKDSTGTPQTAQALSGASTITFEELKCTYRWVRVVYTATSGAITPTVALQVHGTR